MRRSSEVAAMAAVVAVLACGCSRVGEKLEEIPEGATPDDVLRVMGPPVPDARLPSVAKTLPEGCSSQLVYEDEYRNSVIRAVARKKNPTRMLIHVCFDASGHKTRGHTFTLITY